MVKKIGWIATVFFIVAAVLAMLTSGDPTWGTEGYYAAGVFAAVGVLFAFWEMRKAAKDKKKAEAKVDATRLPILFFLQPTPMLEGRAAVASFVMLALIGITLGVAYVYRKKLGDVGPAKGQKYPKKDRWSFYHLGISALITLLGCWIGVPMILSAIFAFLAGAIWEAIMGYIDPWDLAWDFGGVVIGALACLVIF